MNKPYSFIPLLGKKSYAVKGQLYRGKIRLKIKTLTPLYIAKGDIWEEDSGKLRKKFYKINDEYLIPGSSLKGAVRTIAQSISYSCINTRQYKNLIKDYSVCNNRCDCIVCKTFGKMLYKSKVVFKDFKLEGEQRTCTLSVPKLMNPHPEKEFYKENNKFKGIKFYHHGIKEIVESGPIPVEVVKPDSYFQGEVIFENLDIEQLKLLCFSLGLDGSIQLKLGYNKPGYFGSCNIEVLNSEIYKMNGLEVQKISLGVKGLASRWGENNDEIIENINKLKRILSYKNAKKISEWKADEEGRRNY